MDFICVCVRIPKCGSTSLAASLKRAFAGRRIFSLPHTMNLEGSFSAFQHLRFCRTQAKHLFSHYRTANLTKACQAIEAAARDGDLVSGGHIDFESLRQNIRRPVKMITLLRNPAERCRSEYEYCRRGHFHKSYLSRFDAPLKHQMAARYDFHGYLDFLLDHADAYGNLAARFIGWNGADDLGGFFARHVFHSGVLEQSAEFARGLAGKTGTTLFFPHDNRSAKPRGKTRAEESAVIERLYPRDFELYEWQLARLASTRTRHLRSREYPVAYGGEY